MQIFMVAGSGSRFHEAAWFHWFEFLPRQKNLGASEESRGRLICIFAATVSTAIDLGKKKSNNSIYRPNLTLIWRFTLIDLTWACYKFI